MPTDTLNFKCKIKFNIFSIHALQFNHVCFQTTIDLISNVIINIWNSIKYGIALWISFQQINLIELQP